MKTPLLMAACSIVLASAVPSAAQAITYAAPPPLVLSPNLPAWQAPPVPGDLVTVPAPAVPVAPAPAPTNALPAATSTPNYQFDPAFLPTEVPYDGSEAPGTVIVDTVHFYLYLVEPNHEARRYGVGVGRPGFEWAGTYQISRKAEWPGWTPPAEMRKRQPYLPAYMPGGPDNPLGARALYIGSTLYRIHGSNEPWTIGHAVSSGCIRMRNEDVIDLYGRVKIGARVVVM